jgi:pimeloyl-ACP methyl ester carboxylesterase
MLDIERSKVEQEPAMTAFVLVHGAFHGGWCWRDVAVRLRAADHEVFTPTLTGLGERHHLASTETDLETHVQDIVGVIDWEDLHDIVLVGHSYGGMVIGATADRRGERVKAIVYLDALIPRDGMSVFDFNPPERRDESRKAAETFNGWQIPARTAAYYGVSDAAQQDWVDGKCVPHPLKCMTGKPSLSTDPHAGIARRAYVLCTDPPLVYMRQFYDWALAEGDWICREIATGHDLMVTEPKAVSDILLEFA